MLVPFLGPPYCLDRAFPIYSSPHVHYFLPHSLISYRWQPVLWPFPYHAYYRFSFLTSLFVSSGHIPTSEGGTRYYTVAPLVVELIAFSSLALPSTVYCSTKGRQAGRCKLVRRHVRPPREGSYGTTPTQLARKTRLPFSTPSLLSVLVDPKQTYGVVGLFLEKL